MNIITYIFQLRVSKDVSDVKTMPPTCQIDFFEEIQSNIRKLISSKFRSLRRYHLSGFRQAQNSFVLFKSFWKWLKLFGRVFNISKKIKIICVTCSYDQNQDFWNSFKIEKIHSIFYSSDIRKLSGSCPANCAQQSTS